MGGSCIHAGEIRNANKVLQVFLMGRENLVDVGVYEKATLKWIQMKYCLTEFNLFRIKKK
jgi:hypothetical protein